MMTFCFSGAEGSMKDPEILTAGMVGKQIRLEFSPEWDELQKTAVFIGGDAVRNVRNAGEIVEIPHEVLKKSLTPLYVGVYGISLDGSLVIPTIRVQGPVIMPGTNPAEDERTTPALPLWASIEKEIALIRKKLEKGNCLTTAQIDALDGMFRVCAYDGNTDYDAAYEAFRAAFGLSDAGGGEAPDTPVEPEEPAVTLTSISAVYSGGDVDAGTAVADLTGIVVTAHYSDGTSKTVTGYTLSGTIAEGANTVTVRYEGKTATFTVTGVAESGGGESHEGVSSINWCIENTKPEDSNTISSVSNPLKEPDNGYVVTTDTSHTGVDASRPILAWPLISGKTYSIRISNADTASQQFFGLWVSTLNVEPVKGEVTAVTDTIVKNIIAWNSVPASGYRDYSYTAGSDEYLMINANAANVLTITAEVAA